MDSGLPLAAAYSWSALQKEGGCGTFPSKVAERLLTFSRNPRPDQAAEIKEILSQFRMANFFYRLIAKANGADPLSLEVVNAYWQGGALLDQSLSAESLSAVISHNPRPNVWLREKILAGNIPLHHNLYALSNLFQTNETFQTAALQAAAENCRVAWGKVIRITRTEVAIKYSPLTFINCKPAGKVLLGNSRSKTLGRTLLPTIEFEQTVACHAGQAVKILTPTQAEALEICTRKILRAINT